MTKKPLIFIFVFLVLISNVAAQTLIYNSTEEWETNDPDNEEWLYKCYEKATQTYYLMTWDATGYYNCDNVPTDQTGYPRITFDTNQITSSAGATFNAVIEFKAQTAGNYNITYDLVSQGTTDNLILNYTGTILLNDSSIGSINGSFNKSLVNGESLYFHLDSRGANFNDKNTKNEILIYSFGGDNIITISAVNAETSNGINIFNSSIYYEDDTLLYYNNTLTGNILFNMSGKPLENYTIFFYASGFETKNITIEYEAISSNYEFLVNPSPTINLSFYDETTTNIISGINITAEFWNDQEGYKSITQTGNIEQLLGTAGNYNIKFYANGYATKFYFFDIDTNDYKNINLYMSNNSGITNITATIKDQNLNELEGAVFIVEKYNINTGEYLISERLAADFEGKVRFKAIIYDEYYRFKIYFNNILSFQSIPTTIKSEEINFIITLGNSIAQGFNDILNIDYSHYFDNINDRFVFTYSNLQGTVTGINVYTNRITSHGDVLYNSSSQTAASGTIYQSVANISGYYYESCAYGITSNTEELISCEGVRFNEEITENAKTLALFWLFFITVLFAMGALYNISVGLVITPIPFLIFEFIGFTSIGLPYAMGVQVLFIVIALVVNK
ncbi:hypothetical protein DRH27_05805 [Candidatus Falkowbacteria bacterium]|nr:MAG: hypothetical protein DRH27_05805 [Candidatus Falkowbacteria bacterium]